MSKKVRISTAIFGKKVFNSKAELEYYKKYKKINLAKELVMETHEAVGIAEGYIKGYEMQVIIVLHDKEDDKDKIEYSIFEKYTDTETPEDMVNSPAVQVGSILSGFLKTMNI